MGSFSRSANVACAVALSIVGAHRIARAQVDPTQADPSRIDPSRVESTRDDAPRPSSPAAPAAPAAPTPKGPEPASEGSETGAPSSWSDASFHLAWGPTYAEPGVTRTNGTGATIGKTTASFVYVSGDALGGNFFEIDYLQSNDHDPAANSKSGASEFFGIARRTFSFNKISRTKTFAFSVVRDLGLSFEADLSTKNTAFGAAEKLFMIGPTLSFDVPGVWNVGVYADKEWNYNGLRSDYGRSTSGGSVSFAPTVMFLSVWNVPIGKLPFVFEGVLSINLPKGRDGFGQETATEMFLQPKLMWDVTSLWSRKLRGYLVGLGYQYWFDKFGVDHALVAGAVSSTVFVEGAVHF